MSPLVLAVIPARAGSKGLPGKCVAPLRGRPLIEHTIEHALRARRIDAVCVTTDSPAAAEAARRRGVFVVDRPAELATDAAPVDAALRHAVEAYERRHPGFSADVVVLLYANVPVRAAGIIDRCIEHLLAARADSVRTVASVGKHHPDWLHRLDGDRMTPFRQNLIHRRQDLEPLYYHDAAVVAVTRAALYSTPSGPDHHHAFFGRDRRALVQPADAAVDVDAPLDLRIAEALLRHDGVAAPTPIRIGPREIGPPDGVFIIAEAGVNHDGDVEQARRLIHAARDAGADAVKFQAFRADHLVAAGAAACDYQKTHTGAERQRDMLRRLQLDRAAFAALKRTADEAGIIFLATPFGPADLDMLIALDAPAVKIASSDVSNVPLLRAAARCGRPVLVSTGAAEMDEIDAAVALFEDERARDRLALLHCVSRYPTAIEEANLRAIATLQARFGLPVGFSDHTPDVETGGLAAAAGAAILEKHLTLDRGAAGPDHFFSLVPQDFADYVRQSRCAAVALGDGRPACTDGQREVRRLARGSIIAARPISSGTKLTADLLDVQRPAGGIDPGDWDRLLGRETAQPVAAGARLDWSMLRPAR